MRLMVVSTPEIWTMENPPIEDVLFPRHVSFHRDHQITHSGGMKHYTCMVIFEGFTL